MENFYNKLIRNFKLPSKKEFKTVFSSFSKKEWVLFFFLTLVLFFSTIAILQNINKSMMVEVPMSDGVISEGIIGTPRFANPVLAISNADKDIVSLVYSGLMRKGENNDLVPDLAEKYEVSKNGLTYIFTLKNKIYFHDGKPVTADDVVFTINEIKDPIIKSPYKVNWEGVIVEKIDDKTISFTTRQPYSSFIKNMTTGIMPKHIWEKGAIELNNANTNPIGSGPYMVSSVSKDSNGIIDSYVLTLFKKFILNKPYIKKITLNFFANENDLMKAIEDGNIDQLSSITPENAKILEKKGYRIESTVLPRVFGLFFNQNQAQIFTDKKITQAIDLAINKEAIVSQVLKGYGTIANNPIPSNMIAYQKLNESNLTQEERNIKAEKILKEDGWTKGVDGFLEKTSSTNSKKTTKNTAPKISKKLEFTISTGNTIDLINTAELIKQDLEKTGIKVDIKTFDVGNLNQLVIRPRKYDALLFGQVINHESDLYAFWHSSQRKDPGLNVSMYTNSKVDKILEDAFTTVDEKSRIKKYTEFETEIKKDMPAVFLYSPNFIYVISNNLKGISIKNITYPSDRFVNSYLWYTNTDNVWKIFSK